MKSLITLSIAALLSATLPALAGGAVDIPPEPLPVVMSPAPQITVWSGFYAGLAVNRWDGDATPNGLTGIDFGKKTRLGGFIGYNFQNGPMVYGAELAYSPSIGAMLNDPTQDDRLQHMLDLRARLGYATGNALFYGAVGYSRGKMEVNGVKGDAKLSGSTIGIGMDYKFSNNFFAGIDYTHRRLDGRANAGAFDFDVDANTVSLRIGYKF